MSFETNMVEVNSKYISHWMICTMFGIIFFFWLQINLLKIATSSYSFLWYESVWLYSMQSMGWHSFRKCTFFSIKQSRSKKKISRRKWIDFEIFTYDDWMIANIRIQAISMCGVHFFNSMVNKFYFFLLNVWKSFK